MECHENWIYLTKSELSAASLFLFLTAPLYFGLKRCDMGENPGSLLSKNVVDTCKEKNAHYSHKKNRTKISNSNTYILV